MQSTVRQMRTCTIPPFAKVILIISNEAKTDKPKLSMQFRENAVKQSIVTKCDADATPCSVAFFTFLKYNNIYMQEERGGCILVFPGWIAAAFLAGTCSRDG